MKKRKKAEENAELEMTPMIDVVFQLLIFFIVTLKEQDILARLDIQRPSPDPSQTEETVDDLLTITIYDPASEGGGEGVSLNKVKMTLDRLDAKMGRITKYSKTASIVIKCTGASQHSTLVSVLNICSKHNLKNLSVFSL